MLLKDIFLKPVDRAIEGVIKADDASSLKIEIEEYVLTNEVAKRLDSFLEAYNNYQGANGAWLSGFFGSGKSHLLKMLSLLLENRTVDGVSVKEMFIAKCKEDRLLQAKIEKAASISSQSILFNIDQKADVIRKDQVDALLSVFVKVFDETCGYFGKQSYIAQFERDLDSRGILTKFKDEFKKTAGKDWEQGRQQAILEKKHIDAAFNAVSDSNSDGILEKYRTEYRLSIEDFADQVNAYINKKGKDFRLNFFVDEVGQYIADNVKLMTNLQTIAESLNTKCKGRSWLIVTAQEDMNSIIGDMTKKQGNDFTKIQARFENRLKLTSTDVSEVIQVRLLSKTEASKAELAKLYDKQHNNFKTLFDFADGAKVYKNFKDKEHFIASYPFIPYQFDLFQTSIQQLSEHNAFEGKHTAVGERSMLGVFQQVAKQISTKEVGRLATFDLMFEGLRTALKAQIQGSINIAERNLDNKFAIQVLKALFVVKYVKDFKCTVRNLTVLMYDSFDKEIPALKKELEDALSLLEQQTYIQRNGEIFEFLTNDEKDIEEEIKNTEIDNQLLLEDLSKIIFDSILGFRKIRFDQNGIDDKEFARKLDDKLMGREKELVIHIISPFHEHSGNEKVILNQAFAKSELLVILPPDDRLIKDLMMHQKTNRYIRQSSNNSQQDSVARILREKGDQNHRRQTDIEDRLKKLLSEAKIAAGSDVLDISQKDPKGRISEGFVELVKKTYPNLQLLRGTNYSEQQVSAFLNPPSQISFTNDLIKSKQEVLSAIQRSALKGIRMTLKSLISDFDIKPNGWPQAATQCTIAKLCTRGKIELRLDGNLLEGQDLERVIINSQMHAQVIIESQAEFTPSQVRGLKDFYKDFFDEQPKSQEAKLLAKDTIEKFKELGERLRKLSYQKDQFSFLVTLDPALDLVDSLSKKNYGYFLTSLKEVEDKLLDHKEKTIAPIETFMGGAQKDIYKDVNEFFLKEADNFSFIDSTEVSQVKVILADAGCFLGNKIKTAKDLKESIASKLKSVKDKEISEVNQRLEILKTKIKESEGYSLLTAFEKEDVEQIFNKAAAGLEQKHSIESIRHSASNFESSEYNNILTRLMSKKAPQNNTDATLGDKPVEDKKIKLVQLRNIQVGFKKPVLSSDTEVDQYIELLKLELKKELELGNQIQI